MINQRPLLPSTPRAARVVPFGDADGTVISHAGRYARECVLLAFEMIGGVERMADWADRNPDLFYTRLYTKVITREIEYTPAEGIEDLLSRLDNPHYQSSAIEGQDYEVIDNTFETEQDDAE